MCACVQKTPVLGKREVDQLHYTSEKLPFSFVSYQELFDSGLKVVITDNAVTDH